MFISLWVMPYRTTSCQSTWHHMVLHGNYTMHDTVTHLHIVCKLTHSDMCKHILIFHTYMQMLWTASASVCTPSSMYKETRNKKGMPAYIYVYTIHSALQTYEHKRLYGSIRTVFVRARAYERTCIHMHANMHTCMDTGRIYAQPEPLNDTVVRYMSQCRRESDRNMCTYCCVISIYIHIYIYIYVTYTHVHRHSYNITNVDIHISMYKHISLYMYR